MSEDVRQAIRITVDYLDTLMNETPSREVADVSNYLENLLQETE